MLGVLVPFRVVDDLHNGIRNRIGVLDRCNVGRFQTSRDIVPFGELVRVALPTFVQVHTLGADKLHGGRNARRKSFVVLVRSCHGLNVAHKKMWCRVLHE